MTRLHVIQLQSGLFTIIGESAANLTHNVDRGTVRPYSYRAESMERVTISPKFQVLIPRSMRDRLDLRPGQQLQIFPYEGRIELIPLRPACELRGSLSGMPTDLTGDPDRLRTGPTR